MSLFGMDGAFSDLVETIHGRVWEAYVRCSGGSLKVYTKATHEISRVICLLIIARYHTVRRYCDGLVHKPPGSCGTYQDPQIILVVDT